LIASRVVVIYVLSFECDDGNDDGAEPCSVIASRVVVIYVDEDDVDDVAKVSFISCYDDNDDDAEQKSSFWIAIRVVVTFVFQ